MKVLWFSNCVLSREQSRGSGSWLFAMRDLISSDVQMINVTESNVKEIERNEGNGICEYILPKWPLKDGIPAMENVGKIKAIVEREHPDLIHIWGTEKYWSLLFSRDLIRFEKVLLEIQGVLSSCVDVFYGGVLPSEYHNMKSVKSVLFPKSSQKGSFKEYNRNSLREKEIVSHFKYVATQSDWTQDQLLFLCPPETTFFRSLRPVRHEFLNVKKWAPTKKENPVLFFSYSYCSPFKGIHVLLKALHILVCKYPNLQLHIAGPNFVQKPFYRRDEYEQYLCNYISKNSLSENIVFTGTLDAIHLIDQICNADVVINPSFVESYSAAAAEALALGAPTILAYAGAMPGFSKDRPSALYYNPMDYRSLAAKINLIINDTALRDTLRGNALEVMRIKANPEKVKTCQLETYKMIKGEK